MVTSTSAGSTGLKYKLSSTKPLQPAGIVYSSSPKTGTTGLLSQSKISTVSKVVKPITSVKQPSPSNMIARQSSMTSAG